MSKGFYDPSIKYELMEINNTLKVMNGLLLHISCALSSTLTEQQFNIMTETISGVKEEIDKEKEQ